MIVSNGGGSSYAFGNYFPNNETWAPTHTAAAAAAAGVSSGAAGGGAAAAAADDDDDGGAGFGSRFGTSGGDATARTDLGPNANWMVSV